MNIDNLTDISRSDVLRALGLGPRASDYMWPALGVFASGLVLGAGAALLFAPKSGAKLRAEIRDELRTQIEEIERKLGMMKTDEDEPDPDEVEMNEEEGQEQAA
ncbi:hypothetical protein DB30_04681 [Enhygromyxa salina]|uniref:YtxH-like protein n=1 Tax=Enhygromyxa salina TaxID=215803 RepID=A0A0C2D7Y6_9BACT|nr:YtxH domain-containing protein [Enhygromyxa salina]KIG19216.1 hypothetical protein DB30_04681 [Enhygromyxa salina]